MNKIKITQPSVENVSFPTRPQMDRGSWSSDWLNLIAAEPYLPLSPEHVQKHATITFRNQNRIGCVKIAEPPQRERPQHLG